MRVSSDMPDDVVVLHDALARLLFGHDRFCAVLQMAHRLMQILLAGKAGWDIQAFEMARVLGKERRDEQIIQAFDAPAKSGEVHLFGGTEALSPFKAVGCFGNKLFELSVHTQPSKSGVER